MAQKKKKTPKLSKEQRHGQILDVLYLCGGVGGCSRSDIATNLGMVKSPHLINLIEQMVADGWLDRIINPDNPFAGYRYFPSEKLNEWHAKNGAPKAERIPA